MTSHTKLIALDDDLCGFIYTALAQAYPNDIEGKADVFYRAWKAAPADVAGPHGAIRKAITDAYYDARNARETMETAADNARDAVLVALGYVPAGKETTDHA